MANTEQIEAKLCAYVDGELDPADRAEIEAHLEANPQHRQLLADLMAQRELLRGMPRAAAPDDLLDSFQTQLERSVLLEHKPETHVAGHIGRSSQFFAIAAVMVLALGLVSVIVLVVLPDKSKQPKNYAIATTTAPSDVARKLEEEITPTTVVTGAPAAATPGGAAPGTVAPSVMPATPPTAPSEAPGMVADARPMRNLGKAASKGDADGTGSVAQDVNIPRSKAEVIADQSKKAEDIFDKTGPTQTGNVATQQQVLRYQQNMFANAPLDANTAERLRRSPEVPDQSTVVVVNSDNPSATNREVTEYLTSNNIHWEPVAEPMPQPVQMQDDEAALMSKSQRQVPQLQQAPRGQGGGGGERAGGFEQPAQEPQQQRAFNGSNGGGAYNTVPAPAATAAPAATPPATTPPVPGESRARAEADVTTRPAGALDSMDVTQHSDAVAQKTRETSTTGQMLQEPATQPAGAQLIVARGMTRRQADELNTRIAFGNSGRVAQYRRAGDTIAPTTEPSGFAFGGGMSQMTTGSQQPASAAKEAAPTAPVAAPAPGAAPAPVAAAPSPTTTAVAMKQDRLKDVTVSDEESKKPATQDVEKQLATRIDLGAAGPTTVPFQPVASAATTQPLTPLPVPPEVAEQRLTAAATATTTPSTTQAAPGAVAAIPPATLPAVGIAEDRVDMVIVVQTQVLGQTQADQTRQMHEIPPNAATATPATAEPNTTATPVTQPAFPATQP